MLKQRIARAQKTHKLDLSNSIDGRQSTFQFQEVPGAVLSAFRIQGKPRQNILAEGLRELWLTNNQLSVVKPELRQLKALEVLCLSGNKLTKVPAFLGGMKRLRRLMLSRNSIQSIPDELQNLRSVMVFLSCAPY